jgi:hypothetical protein
VLCDGVDALPPADALGEPWRVLHDLTWRRLRAYDWAADVQRLINDLCALGVPEHAPPAAATAPRRRWLLPAGGALLAVAAAGGAGWWAYASREAATPRQRLGGRWQGVVPSLGAAVLVLRMPAPGRIVLTSEPIVIAQQPQWAEYRVFWRQRFGGAELDSVTLRGEGMVIADPAQPLRVDIALALHPAGGGGDNKIDGGNLSAALSADGRRLDGEVWLNSRQKGEAVTLQRK